jgi:hypothetical protein
MIEDLETQKYATQKQYLCRMCKDDILNSLIVLLTNNEGTSPTPG